MVGPAPPLTVIQSPDLLTWLDGLRDQRARTVVSARIARLRRGLKGDTRALGAGVAELRVDYGPGYRLYYVQRGETVMLLCGGDKSSQSRDIRRAGALAEELGSWLSK